MLAIDRILAKCGDFHRLQVVMLVLFCVINLLSAMHYYSQTIISFEPTYWCADDSRGETQGVQEHNSSSCYLPSMSTGDGDTNSSAPQVCEKYSYELYMNYHSFTSELDWICDSAWKLTLGQSMFFVGSVLGTLVFGILADVVGRLPILILSNVVAMVGNTLTIFGTELWTFCLFRFISGLATDSNFVMMYILVMEYLRPSLRTVGLSICIGFFYCLGSMAAPWIAVLMGSWRGFLLATSVPFIMVPFFYFVVPESVQWLISKQKYEKAVQCLQRVAKFNGRQVDETVFNEFIEDCKRSQVHTKAGPNLLHLFASPRLRKNTLILFFKSMVITLCYDAVSRNVQGLGISPFVMFSLSATAILPACLLLILLQDRIGRKAMASMSLLLSGIFISVTGFIIFQNSGAALDQNVTLIVTLSVIGRFGVTVAYNSGAQYATELIPTCVRGQGVAAVHVMGYAFTFFSSYILYTRSLFSPLPEIILGVISLLGGALCLLLPETLNRTLPNSLEDGENFGRNEHWYTFSFLEKRTVSVATLNSNMAQEQSQSHETTAHI